MSETALDHTHDTEAPPAHHGWPRKWWHYPFMPMVLVLRLRPSRSARSWFIWGVVTSILHGIVILAMFGIPDAYPAAALDWMLYLYPPFAAFVTLTQVKSIGERPPGQEEWDKLDNKTSYVPIACLMIGVPLLWLSHSVMLNFTMEWWGIWGGMMVIWHVLPAAFIKIAPMLFVAFCLAASDAGLIDIQYLVSRGLTRVKAEG